jgi:glycosyltransferase involved in cell wall biosynthesis
MLSKDIKDFVKKSPGVFFAFRLLANLYSRIVWGFFSPFLEAYCFTHAKRPKKVRSVLHVSVLSHKPYMLSRLMREKGVGSEYLAVAAETGWLKFGSRGYDYNLSNRILTRLFRPFVVIGLLWFVLRKYDVIHYHFGSILTTNGIELYFLKKMGKLLVFHYRGCDLRQKSLNNQMNPDLNCCQECDYPAGSCDQDDQKRRLSLAKKYGDLFFVTTPDLRDFLPEAEHLPFVAPSGIDVTRIVPAEKTPGVFRVVTSSNHDGVDGTEYVRKAIKRLQDEGRKIELVEIHKTPYEKTLAIYKSGDIYAGKLRMGYYNNANIECLMMGVPCVSYIREAYLPDIQDCPIIIARPENVYEKICECLEMPEAKLKEIGQKGIEFIRRRHNQDAIIEHILGRYEEALARRPAIL